jgi:hypothetical protein
VAPGWLLRLSSPIVSLPGSLLAALTNQVDRAELCQKADPNGR